MKLSWAWRARHGGEGSGGGGGDGRKLGRGGGSSRHGGAVARRRRANCGGRTIQLCSDTCSTCAAWSLDSFAELPACGCAVSSFFRLPARFLLCGNRPTKPSSSLSLFASSFAGSDGPSSSIAAPLACCVRLAVGLRVSSASSPSAFSDFVRFPRQPKKSIVAGGAELFSRLLFPRNRAISPPDNFHCIRSPKTLEYWRERERGERERNFTESLFVKFCSAHQNIEKVAVGTS